MQLAQVKRFTVDEYHRLAELGFFHEDEPDFTTVRQRSDNYLSAHPNPTDVLVVIEIAGSSLKYDQ